MRIESDGFIMKKIYKWLAERENNKMKFPIGFAFNDESMKVAMGTKAQQEVVQVKRLSQV